MFRGLPSALIIAVLALLSPRTASQKCMLVYEGSDSYGNPAVGHSPNGSKPTVPTSVTTRQPFNYGKDIVRGVNLWVSSITLYNRIVDPFLINAVTGAAGSYWR